MRTCPDFPYIISTFLRNIEYLYSSTFQKYLDVHVLFVYIWLYFSNIQWVAGVGRVSCSLSSVSSVAPEWAPHKHTVWFKAVCVQCKLANMDGNYNSTCKSSIGQDEIYCKPKKPLSSGTYSICPCVHFQTLQLNNFTLTSRGLLQIKGTVNQLGE